MAFARTLRAAGVPASPDRVTAALAALGHVDVLAREDVYWTGRATLCGSADDLPRYDRAFTAFFSGERGAPLSSRPRVTVVRAVALADPGAGSDPGGEEGDETSAAVAASRAEVLRHRDVARLGAVERAELN
ncbi:MAG: hypothetical protein M3P96_12550, partial [Actinomycetota bacterium]|nr:hypothetical protein [Actinomycetota bacterium]